MLGRAADDMLAVPPVRSNPRPDSQEPLTAEQTLKEGAVMYARIIRAQAPPDRFDEVLSVTTQVNVPFVKRLPGFRVGYWSGDRNTGRVVTVVLFGSADGIRAADVGLDRMRPLIEPLGVRLESVENLEVFMAEPA
jgi:hypothetical protein